MHLFLYLPVCLVWSVLTHFLLTLPSDYQSLIHLLINTWRLVKLLSTWPKSGCLIGDTCHTAVCGADVIRSKCSLLVHDNVTQCRRHCDHKWLFFTYAWWFDTCLDLDTPLELLELVSRWFLYMHEDVTLRWSCCDRKQMFFTYAWWCDTDRLVMIVIQVSFTPVCDGVHTGTLRVMASPASSKSTHSNSPFQASVQLGAVADTPAVQVICHVAVFAIYCGFKILIEWLLLFSWYLIYYSHVTSHKCGMVVHSVPSVCLSSLSV